MIDLEFKNKEIEKSIEKKEEKKVKKHLESKKVLKTEYAIIGGGIGSLLFALEQVNKGVEVSLFEKNAYFGSYFSSKIFSEFSKISSCSYEIPLLMDANENGYLQKYFLKYSMRNLFSFSQNKVWLKIINRNSNFEVYSDWKLTFTSLKQKYSISRTQIESFFETLKKVYNDFSYIKVLKEEYQTTENYLKIHFDNNYRKFNIWLFLELYLSTKLENLDLHAFFLACSYLLIGKIVFFKNGNDEFIEELINKINLAGLTFPKTEIIKISNAIDYVNQINTDTKTIKSKKFAIGINPEYAFKTLIKKTDLSAKYLDLLKDLQKNHLKDLTILISFKKAPHIYKIEEPIYLFNESDIQFAEINELNDLEKIPFILYNKNAYNNSSKNGIVLKIWVSNDLENNLQKTKLEEILYLRMKKVFKIDKEIIENMTILDSKEQEKIFNCINGQNSGISFDDKNPWNSRIAASPLRNLQIIGNYGAYGNELLIFKILNAIRTSNISFVNLKKDQKFSIIDILEAKEILELLKENYIGFDKYNDKTIGFTFDEKYHFVMTMRKNKVCTLKETTFDEAIKSYIFVWTTTKDFKNIITNRTSILKMVFAGKFKVRGGVFLLKKMLKKAFVNWNTFHKQATL